MNTAAGMRVSRSVSILLFTFNMILFSSLYPNIILATLTTQGQTNILIIHIPIITNSRNPPMRYNKNPTDPAMRFLGLLISLSSPSRRAGIYVQNMDTSLFCRCNDRGGKRCYVGNARTGSRGQVASCALYIWLFVLFLNM